MGDAWSLFLRSLLLTSASKFNIVPNGGPFDASLKNDRTSSNVLCKPLDASNLGPQHTGRMCGCGKGQKRFCVVHCLCLSVDAHQDATAQSDVSPVCRRPDVFPLRKSLGGCCVHGEFEHTARNLEVQTQT